MNLQFAIDFLPLVLRAEHRGFPGLSIPPQKLPEQEGLENLRPGLWWWSMEDLKRFLGLHNKLWDLCPCLCLRYTKCHTFAAGYLHLFGLWTFAPLHLRGFAMAFGAPLMLTVLAGWRCAGIVISLMRLMLVAMALRPIWPYDTSLFLLRFSDSLLSHDSNVGVAVFDPSLPVTTFRNGRYTTSWFSCGSCAAEKRTQHLKFARCCSIGCGIQ